MRVATAARERREPGVCDLSRSIHANSNKKNKNINKTTKINKNKNHSKNNKILIMSYCGVSDRSTG